MSVDEVKKTPAKKPIAKKAPVKKTEDKLSPELSRKIEFLKKNPNANIVVLTDNEKGSSSNAMFGSLSTIDGSKKFINEMLNLKIEVNDYDEFIKEYAIYAKDNFELTQSLKKVTNSSIKLLNMAKKTSSITNGRLRKTVEDRKKPSFNNKTEEKK